VREKLSAGYDLELFFSNSNIYPNAEYKKRLREVKKLAKRFNLKVKIDPYRHQEWKKAIAGHENDPEGGERCELCFIHRLKKTADMAKKSGFSAFTSTLSISPHKSTDMINRSGREAGEKLGIQYLEYDFKEQNGFSRSVELSKEYGLYRQKYCGCEFSIRPKKKT
jgi:predicted adenine nucleotide alpha hydrolase (AANH) superfamily ATPase